MGFPVKDAWHHWTYTSAAGYANQVAGYATEYDVSKQGDVSFARTSTRMIFLCCRLCVVFCPAYFCALRRRK